MPASPACSRTFVAVIAGVVVGILGVEGWWGFLLLLGTQLLVRARGAGARGHACGARRSTAPACVHACMCA